MIYWDDLSSLPFGRWFWEDEIYQTWLLLERLSIHVGDYFNVHNLCNSGKDW